MVDFFHQQLSNRPVSAGDRATYSEIVRWLAIGALFLSLILAYAWSHNEIMNLNYRMQEVRKENQELSENTATLRAEYSSLVNPERIDQAARRLGLVASNRTEVRILQSYLPVIRPSQNVVAQSRLEELEGKTLNE